MRTAYQAIGRSRLGRTSPSVMETVMVRLPTGLVARRVRKSAGRIPKSGRVAHHSGSVSGSDPLSAVARPASEIRALPKPVQRLMHVSLEFPDGGVRTCETRQVLVPIRCFPLRDDGPSHQTRVRKWLRSPDALIDQGLRG